MNKKQYNTVIEHTLLSEPSNDSLDTARSIFNNLGVALPQGNMKQVYDTLQSNDYMGWRSCSMKEAQKAANEGVAAIGISENKIVVLSANDEEQPVRQTASVIAINGSTPALLLDGLQYFSYCCGTTCGDLSCKEIVVIEKDGNYSNVVFEDGKTWKGNVYFYNDQLNAYYPYDGPRAQHNLSLDFSIKQLGLLFRIDPQGVISYLTFKTLDVATPTDCLIYRDNLFQEIYGREPRYFTVENDQFYYCSGIDYDNRYSVYSEAELIFGMLPRWNGSTLLFNFAKALLSFVLSFVPTELALTFDIIVSFFFTNAIDGAVNAAAIEFFKKVSTSVYEITIPREFDWATIIIGLIPSLFESVLPPDIDEAQISILENANGNESYQIKISDNNQTVDLSQFIEHYRSLL